jgi:hypothetical protein
MVALDLQCNLVRPERTTPNAKNGFTVKEFNPALYKKSLGARQVG